MLCMVSGSRKDYDYEWSSIMNNFDDYVFIYEDSFGNWNTATNPVFIAEHKHCKAIKKTDKKTLKKYLYSSYSAKNNLLGLDL